MKKEEKKIKMQFIFKDFNYLQYFQLQNYIYF